MKSLVLLSAIFFLSVVNCNAGENVVSGACDPWPPFVDPSSPKGGLSIEVIRAAYATQGYTLKMEYVPWARAEAGVKKGLYDILPPTWMTEKRKGYLMYSDPYAVNQVKFIKRKEDPFEYKGIESLTGKRIGMVRGYGYADELMNATNYKKELTRDFITNIKMLTHHSKRIDLAIEDEAVARMLISEEEPTLLKKIQFTKSALVSNGLYVASGLANPRHKELIDTFNKGLAEIKANGEYAKILESYGMK